MKAYTSALHLGKMTTIEKGLRHASKHNKTFHPSSYAWLILYALANHDQHVILFIVRFVLKLRDLKVRTACGQMVHKNVNVGRLNFIGEAPES